ncbi:MAG: ABC-type transport auxiliary lipoprotein family protein [Desulfuromonadaceae bacterium]|nr:ABC-type transport auxiliary lipoprotein family protein [Desulfuromonas sp.]MDY0185725.1 ABC-type transport auxiliary lipoprotein family protein [Desulfuromonadaceae bacterium]
MICIKKHTPSKYPSVEHHPSGNLRRARSILARGICGGILVGVAFILSACSIFPSREPLTVYVLRPPSTLETQVVKCASTVQVHRPKAGGVLNSSKIVVMPAPQQLSVYKGVRWDEALPRAVQDYLIETLRSSAAFPVVIGTESRIKADFYLDSTMRSFQSSYVRAAENGGNPVVEVEYTVQLVKADTNTIVAQQNFLVLQPSAGTEVNAVVRAFNSAAAILSAQVVEWTVTHIAQAKTEE